MVLGLFEGKIDIQLDKSRFTLGDTVKGKLTLDLKKDLETRGLKVKLEVVKITKSRGYDEYQTQTETTMTLKKIEKKVTDKTSFSKGRESFEFELKVPEDVKLPKKRSGLLGAVVNAFTNSGKIEWRLTAYLDMPNAVDIKQTKKLKVLY